MAARIPTVAQLGAGYVPGQSGTIVRDNSAGAYANIAGSIAGAAGQKLERNDRFNYAKARSALLQADIEARRALENDKDYGTHEKRYREGMAKARDEALRQIRDPGDRVMFEQESGLDIERGSSAVHDGAWRMEVDFERANLQSLLMTNRAAALNAKDEATRAAIVNSSMDAVKGATAKGYLNEVEGKSAWETWRTGYAEGRIVMLEPEERIAMLKNPQGTAADYLDPDVRTKLLRAAENENKEERTRAAAQTFEDSIWAQGGSLESMRAKARKIADPAVRDSVIMRIEARGQDILSDMDRNDKLTRRQAWDVIEGGGKWEDIPVNVAASMNPEDALQIKKFLAGGGETDRATWYALTQQAGDDPKGFAAFDLLKVKGALDESDFEEMAKLQEKIKADVRAGDPIATDNQLVSGALREMGVKTTGKIGERDAKRTEDFRYAFGMAVNRKFRELGRAPTFAEKQQVVDQLMIEVKAGETWYGSDIKAKLFEAPNEVDPTDVIVPKADRQQIIDALKRKNIPATEERIRELYLRGKFKPVEK